MKKSIKDFPILKVAYNDALTDFMMIYHHDIDWEKYEENYPVECKRLDDHKAAIYALYRCVDRRFDDLQLTLHDTDKTTCNNKTEHKMYAPHHMLVRPWSYGECYLDSCTLMEIALDVIAAHFIKHEAGNTPIPIPCHPSVPVAVRQLIVNSIEFVRVSLIRDGRNELKEYDPIFDKYPELKDFANNPQYTVNFCWPEDLIMFEGALAQSRYDNDRHITHIICAMPGMGKTTALRNLETAGYSAIELEHNVSDNMKARLRTNHMRMANSAYINALAMQNCDFIFAWYDQIDFTILDWSRIQVHFFMPYNVGFAVDNVINRQSSSINFVYQYQEHAKEWYNDWVQFISTLEDVLNVHVYYNDTYVSDFIEKFFNIKFN